LTAKTATSFTQRVDGRKIYRDANGGYFILNGFGEPIQTTSTGATLNGGWHKVDHRTLLRLARGSKPAFRRSDGKKVFSDGAGRFFIVAGGEVVFVGKNGFPISTAVIVDRLPSDYWWRSARNSRPEFVRDDEVEVFRGPYGTRYILSARGKPIFVDKTGKALQKGTYPPASTPPTRASPPPPSSAATCARCSSRPAAASSCSARAARPSGSTSAASPSRARR